LGFNKAVLNGAEKFVGNTYSNEARGCDDIPVFDQGGGFGRGDDFIEHRGILGARRGSV
jgi:hypothetical protein